MLEHGWTTRLVEVRGAPNDVPPVGDVEERGSSVLSHPLGGVCLQPGQVPYNVPGSGTAPGQPSTEAQLLAYLAQPRTLANLAPLQSDDNKNGDVLDHYSGKPLPDFEGAFGGSLTWRKNWRISTNFEYRGGHYTISNLTQAFRTGSPTNGGIRYLPWVLV